MNFQPRLDVYMSILGFLVLIINFITMINTFPRKRKMVYCIAAMILLTAATVFYRQLTVNLIHWNGLQTFFYLALMIWMLKGSIFQITFAFYLEYIFAIALLYLTEAIVSIFVEQSSNNFTFVLFIPMMLLFSIYTFVMCKYGKQVFAKLLDSNRTSEWALYASGAVFSFVFLTISRDYPGTVLFNIVLLIFILWSFIVFCFAIVNTHEKARRKYEAEIARSIVSSGQNHYQKMNEMYDKLRVLRHDYKYHLSAARKMLGAGDTEGADNYLTGIQKQLAGYELKRYCDNSVINAFIDSYAERSSRLGIKFEVNINIPESSGVPDYDICVIIGNLLENAVEACLKTEDERSIRLETQEIKTQRLFMVKNSFDGIITETGGTPVSSKPNGGFGLKSVREVLSRHGGSLSLEWDKNSFTAYAAVKL